MHQKPEQSTFHIHFVCTGNAYRSRLAEAYLNSLQRPGLHTSSSGIAADRSFQYNGPISWYAMRLISTYRLIPFMSAMAQQTTTQLLARADLIVFMCQEHCDYATHLPGYQHRPQQVWDIEDMNTQHLDGQKGSVELLLACIESSEETFKRLKEKIDTLVRDLEISTRQLKYE